MLCLKSKTSTWREIVWYSRDGTESVPWPGPESRTGSDSSLGRYRQNHSIAANNLMAVICHEDKHICSSEKRTLQLVTFVFQSFQKENATFSNGYFFGTLKYNFREAMEREVCWGSNCKLLSNRTYLASFGCVFTTPVVSLHISEGVMFTDYKSDRCFHEEDYISRW